MNENEKRMFEGAKSGNCEVVEEELKNGVDVDCKWKDEEDEYSCKSTNSSTLIFLFIFLFFSLFYTLLIFIFCL